MQDDHAGILALLFLIAVFAVYLVSSRAAKKIRRAYPGTDANAGGGGGFGGGDGGGGGGGGGGGDCGGGGGGACH
jgi:hypothetical protein